MASENSSEDEFETLHGPVRPYLFEPTAKPGAEYHFIVIFYNYYSLIVTYLLSCAVSEIQRPIGPKSLYSATPLVFNSPTEAFPWDDLRKIFTEASQIAKVPNGVETLPKISVV